MHTPDSEEDAREILEFFVALAHEDADRVGAFLKSAGFEPGTEFPATVLVKLAVWCRLCRWEASGLTAQAERQLPSSDEVFVDILEETSGRESRWVANDLSLRVMRFQMERLTWPQTSGSTFLINDASAPDDFFDSMAELLWELRDLVSSPGALSDSDHAIDRPTPLS
jgi:hypothetical protein